MDDRIKRIVNYYVKKLDTRNPFDIADFIGVLYQRGNIGCEGCYLFLKNHRYIFLNQDLLEQEAEFVMAHELGHALMHRKQNCYFIRNKTLLLNSKIEIAANTFAAELLIPDELIYENPGLSKSQIAKLAGFEEKIMDFKKL